MHTFQRLQIANLTIGMMEGGFAQLEASVAFFAADDKLVALAQHMIALDLNGKMDSTSSELETQLAVQLRDFNETLESYFAALLESNEGSSHYDHHRRPPGLGQPSDI